MLRNPYSNHYHQIPNPPSPYHGEIPQGLQAGKHIFVRGAVFGDAKRFRVDLESNDGVALHFNPRFDQHCVVRNTLTHGRWGSEERNGPFPFSQAGAFEIDFHCLEDKYLVTVNKGAAVYEYHHRQPLQNVYKMTVEGDIHIEKITFYSDAPRHFNEVQPNSLPLDIPLHNVHPGKLVHIRGHTHSHTNRFFLNLQNGVGDHCDIALHFSVRFDDPYNGQVVVRTNKKHGGWGHEERDHTSFPFAKESSFDILILFADDRYKVAVNGKHFVEFLHRNHQDAEFLHIDGDVAITSIREF